MLHKPSYFTNFVCSPRILCHTPTKKTPPPSLHITVHNPPRQLKSCGKSGPHWGVANDGFQVAHVLSQIPVNFFDKLSFWEGQVSGWCLGIGFYSVLWGPKSKRGIGNGTANNSWMMYPNIVGNMVDKWYLSKLQVVPGRAGGGSFRRKKNYIAKKEFAYRMCDRPARCPNHFFAVNEPSAVPWWWCDLFWCMSCHLMWWSCHVLRCDCLCCVMSRDAMRCHVMCAHVMCPAMVTLCVRSGSVTMWWSKVLFCTTVYYCVLQSTTPVLLCTTQYYNVLLQYYSVLLQYYSVLQSTTPVLLCTTQYYNVLLQYYSVLQSTILYCAVLQYYSVLQSTTPVLLCTTQYYNVLLQYYPVLLLQYYPVLQRTTPVLLCTTKYYSVLHYNVLLQYYPVLQSTTPVLPCTAKYYSSTTVYYKVLLQYYSVLHSTTTYYSSTTLYYKVLLQYYSVLQSATPGLLCTTQYCSSTTLYYNARSNRSHPPTSPNTAPATQNDCDDWSASHMKRHLQCAEQQESQSNFTKYCACHAKWISWLIRLTYETSFRMRGASKVNLEPHQILRLPRKMNLMIDPRHIWNII